MTRILLLLIVLTTGASLQAQDLIPGFEFAEEATIYVTDTDSIQGVVGFSYIKNNEINLVGEKVKKYKADEIKGFYLKTSKLKFLSGRGGLGQSVFVQDLTPKNKAGKIVKTFVFAKGTKVELGKEPEGTWSTSLYIVSKGGNYEGFKKIADAVKDQCPGLAAKISDKTSGYSTKFLSTEEETMAAYEKIITDLEAGCK